MDNENTPKTFTCDECGKLFNGEEKCPHCGHKNRISKKNKAALVVVCIIIALAIIALILSYVSKYKLFM